MLLPRFWELLSSKVKAVAKSEQMKPTGMKFAKIFTPSIKFVGGRHTIKAHTGPIGQHPCTINGISPGGPECVPAAEYLKHHKPFVVTAYINPNSKSKVADANQNGPKYDFDRPLKENEVSSIFELASRFKYKPLDEIEMEVINNGGAL